MIQQIFKIIWTERKINIWILFELLLVFCILWFCVDYIYYFTKRYIEPTGYNVEHVYNINLGTKEEGRIIISNGTDAQKDTLLSTLWTIIDRINNYPDIEYISLSFAASPYSSSFSNYAFTLDSVIDHIQIKTITPDFFKVFDINLLHGKTFDWNSQNNIIISGNSKNVFLEKDVSQIKTLDFDDRKNLHVIGAVETTKRSEFNTHESNVYTLLQKNDRKIIEVSETEICVRVKPHADKDFIERFTKDIQEQIALDPYFLSSVTPFSDLKNDYMKWNGYDNNFKSIFSVSTFLLINIFLAIVGTFWFRIQARRCEIGLRIALGSTRMNIKAIFIVETLILILLASILAAPICINIALIDVLKDIGVPVIKQGEDTTQISQYLINYSITLLILIIISVSAVWYPSNKASKTRPAEALQDE